MMTNRRFDIGERDTAVSPQSWEFLRKLAAEGSHDAYLIAMELNTLHRGLQQAWERLNQAGVEPPENDLFS